MKRKPLKGVESVFDLKDPHPEKDVIPDPEQARIKAQLDKALKETFPASDSVSVLQPTTIGPKETAGKAPGKASGKTALPARRA